VKYPHIASRIFNTPLLIHPQKLDAIIAGLGERLLGGPILRGGDGANGAVALAPELAPELFSTRKGERVREAGWPGYLITEGVAVVSANGGLVHRTKMDAESNLLLGYNDIAAATEHAMQNDAVHAVLQVYDSPGGEVAGAFEYAQRMEDMRGKKPLYAIADNMAASAAYLGGSAAEKLFITSTGYAGSIGVVMRHVDFSAAIAKEGIAVEYIFAGAHKIDGNPFSKLPASVRADLQAEINTLYEMFVAAVARQTGLSAEAIRGTEARTYMGQAAVDVGLAAGVTTTDALITELASHRARSYPAGQSGTGQAKGNSMTAPNAAPVLTQADLEKARAEGFAAGKAEGVAEGTAAGAKAERDRTAAILAHKEADGRGAMAAKCVSMGLTVDQAGELLAASPKADAKGAGGNAFAAAMASQGNPDVTGGEPGANANLDADSPQVIAAGWDKAFGTQQKRSH
jgi:signal peptide peptidase SppA